MGFFSIIDDDIKPSDEYLASHELEGYSEGDMEHDDYDIMDDVVALNCIRKCNNCSKSFTLANAIKEFDNSFSGEFEYMEEFTGEMCGKCAVEFLEEEL